MNQIGFFSSAAMSSSDAGVAHTDLSQSGFARSARLAWASIHSTTPAHRDLVNMSPAGSIFRGELTPGGKSFGGQGAECKRARQRNNQSHHFEAWGRFDWRQ
ncbi:hypothetical protein [Xanthomonas theicola]|uniref:hypothetical protein n=1 Tax=Xanthomonas theicola TaxID=56464 RepID=UPI000FF8B499|nr:hypothetical protein [Xanthomonas theicola]QNH26327.1 hypothetical protein G4Q83_18560 [Xanthomonas theicola]